jgi:serine/threonine protein kinase/lipoprotein NlpI
MFHAALDLPVDQRSAFLVQACAGDESLYAEVSSLVSACDRSNGFMDQPILDVGFRILSQAPKESLSGKTIGVYKVLSRLGEGGMGEVYLAEDTRLGRKVALKFLSPDLIDDNWARRQLIKEAQAVAPLGHPNVCTVFGIEEHENRHFIVMQYVEGETLAQMIRSKTLESDQILNLAQQIVGAIDEAHAHGIIHRDIKPGNIMVTTSGQVKVLDFGLAKIIQQKQSLAGSESVSELSRAGIFQGTVAYMSPEQLRGEKLDYRTDIFSIGTVLYEMISGSNPHACETNAEIISCILGQKPASLNRGSNRVSHQLDATVLKCLEKEKEERYQSAAELLLRLQSIQHTPESRFQVLRRLDSRLISIIVLLCLAAVVFTFLYVQWTRPRLIVVAPIKNETGEPDLEYLADGLTDSFINRLTGLSNLQVKSASFGYKNQNANLLKVGRDLEADGVLVGTISGRKDLPVLQLSLIRTADGSEIWHSQYSVDLQKVFDIEAAVAKSVVVNLESASREDETRISKLREPQNPDARKEYWLGLYYWRNRNNDGSLYTAIDHFNNAIKLEPSYARAHAGLADCYAYLNTVAYGHMDTKEAMPKAEKAARDALELDPNLAEAHTSLAIVNLKYFWNWAEAEKEFKLAIALKPDYVHAHYGYSMLLTVLGKHDESIAEGQIAKDLDPFSPAATLNYCRTLYFARRFDESRPCFDKLISEQPAYTPAQYSRALFYLLDGMYPEALIIFERIYSSDPRFAAAFVGYTYGVLGRTKDAERVLANMQQLPNLEPQESAFVYLGLGKMDQAIELLQRSAEKRYAPFPFLATDPLFQKLQSDPRFVALIKNYNLPAPTTN